MQILHWSQGLGWTVSELRRQWLWDTESLLNRVTTARGRSLTEENLKVFGQSHACRKFQSRCLSWKELKKFHSKFCSIWDSWKVVKRRKSHRLLLPPALNLKRQSLMESSHSHLHTEQKAGPATLRNSDCWRQCWVHRWEKMIQEDHFESVKR